MKQIVNDALRRGLRAQIETPMNRTTTNAFLDAAGRPRSHPDSTGSRMSSTTKAVLDKIRRAG